MGADAQMAGVTSTKPEHAPMSGDEAKAKLVATADTAPKNTIWKAIKPFVNGGASGMLATCVIQPVDMVKVRLQLGATGSPVRTLRPRPLTFLGYSPPQSFLLPSLPSGRQ